MYTEIISAVHAMSLLAFGLVLSFAFSGIEFRKKSIFAIAAFFVINGLLQSGLANLFDTDLVYKLYPFVTHLPLILVVCLGYKKRFMTALAAVTTAYLCCQPAAWIGIISEYLSDSIAIGKTLHVATLLLTSIIFIRYLAPAVSEMYAKTNRDILIFCSVPIIYYLFDYILGVYTSLWSGKNNPASEFLPLVICISFLGFAVLYYQEYEKKSDAIRREYLANITIEQKKKEYQAVNEANTATRLMRHDMRHLLNTLAVSIENDDKDSSLSLISRYISELESVAVQRYCENDTLNYVLTSFKNKCDRLDIKFATSVQVPDISVDETMFASIVSNALENALNAQKALPVSYRKISLTLKSNEKVLLLPYTSDE